MDYFVFTIICSHFATVWTQVNVLPEFTIHNSKSEEGRQQYEILVTDSKLPRYGTCWKTALENLHSACNQLTEESQSRMSLAFINCFLAQSGKKTFPCPPSQELSSCLKKMDTLSFQIYANYLPHTQNMCFFILSQVWTEEIGSSVSTLMTASNDMRSRLEESAETQGKVLEAQRKSLRNENKLLEKSAELMASLENSKSNVMGLLDNFKEATEEQKMVINGIFDRFLKFQSMFFGEFSGFFSVVYHVAAVLLSYVLTTPVRCSNARFWLFLIALTNILLERCLTDRELEQFSLDPEGSKIVLYQKIWYCRTVCGILAVAVWIIMAIRYKDYAYTNYVLLESIQKQNEELKELIMSNSFVSRSFLDTSIPRNPNQSVEYRDPALTGKLNLSSEEDDPTFTCSDTDSSSDISGYETEFSYATSVQPQPTVTRGAGSRPCKVWGPSPPSRYNLRDRTSTVRSFNVTTLTETPEMFAETVNKLAKDTKKNSLKIRRSALHQSSDEDLY